MSADRQPRKGRGAMRDASSNGEPDLSPPPVEGQEDLAYDEGDTSFDPATLESGPGPAVPPAPTGPDLFDPANLGISQDFAAACEVAKQWDVIKVEKPSKEDVFRVHPTFHLRTMLLMLKRTNEVYVVPPSMQQVLADESTCGIYTLFACVTMDEVPLLWPIRMADGDGKWNVWHESAWNVALKARERWARMQAKQTAGHYVATYDQRPVEQQRQPTWPDLPFRTWLELAFKGKMITSPDHLVLKKLRLED